MKLLGTDMKNLGETLSRSSPIFKYLETTLKEIDGGEGFQYAMGGFPYLVESKEDLAKVSDGKFSLLDKPLNLDICEHIDKEYVLCFFVTNNGGGDSYFIPRSVWADNANIAASIEAYKIGKRLL